MIESVLKDGTGNKCFAEVTTDREQLFIQTTYPPLKPQKVRPFRQFMTTTGLPSGSNDMGIDGSSTNVDFWIPSHDKDDRYITALNIIVGYGASGKPYQWANGTALTNGMRLFYISERGEVDIHEAIKTNQDMFRLSFGLIPKDWEVTHVNANQDFGYIFSFDLTLLGLTHGIKLDAGTTQKIVMRVRDNAGLDADSFNVIAYGMDRFK